ncbi:hypothetical protein NGRA_2464 [Nosema granulosis]|uniref:Uncharacterized protein n=1 Tax=Nosema granulosis TaxID=83296 RepID=A0A9P6GXL9_9MICR|nr:hypothetical protein NGRA_2464 [Nosema granulosis]
MILLSIIIQRRSNNKKIKEKHKSKKTSEKSAEIINLLVDNEIKDNKKDNKQADEEEVPPSELVPKIKPKQTENDFYSMVSQFKNNNDVAFFAKDVHNSYNYLYCFKKAPFECHFVRVKKNEASFKDYLVSKNIELVKKWDDKDFYYFTSDNTGLDHYVTGVISGAIRLSNSVIFGNLLKIIRKFPYRQILRGVYKNDQKVSHFLFSYVVLVLIKIYRYYLRNIIDMESSLYRDILSVFNGKILLEKTDPQTEQVFLFFQYVFKELDLPSINKDESYQKLKQYVVHNEMLEKLDNMSVSFEGIIEDIPFNMIEHIFDSYCAVAMN